MFSTKARRWAFVMALLVALAWPAAALARGNATASEQQQLVQDAQATFRHFRDDRSFDSFREHEKEALGFLILPKAVRASLVLGGSGGRAVLVAKDDAGNWVGPSFYKVATASIGPQAGVDVSEIVVFVMTRRGMDALLASTFKMGVDASVAAGPVGAGIGRPPRPDTDFIYYTRSRGFYAGGSIEGAMIRTADSWNRAYYQKPVSPVDIVVRGSCRNPLAKPLLETVELSVRRS